MLNLRVWVLLQHGPPTSQSWWRSFLTENQQSRPGAMLLSTSVWRLVQVIQASDWLPHINTNLWLVNSSGSSDVWCWRFLSSIRSDWFCYPRKWSWSSSSHWGKYFLNKKLRITKYDERHPSDSQNMISDVFKLFTKYIFNNIWHSWSFQFSLFPVSWYWAQHRDECSTGEDCHHPPGHLRTPHLHCWSLQHRNHWGNLVTVPPGN